MYNGEYKKVMVIEKYENIDLSDDTGYRPVLTYDNVLSMDSFYHDCPYNRLWLADGKTATFNAIDYYFVIF